VGDSGHVVAFEPEPTNRDLLSQTVQRNDMDWIDIHGVALSDHKGRKELGLHPSNKGRHSLTDTEARSSISVEVTTLDSLEVEYIDFIKLDVEGAEELVIEGGQQMISKFQPTMLFEFMPESLDEPRTLLELLTDLGYEFESVNLRCLSISEAIEMGNNDRLVDNNIVAVPKEE
jgi:FkbM family methyltransferase